jgi:two-component system repressor protein LuxO
MARGCGLDIDRFSKGRDAIAAHVSRSHAIAILDIDLPNMGGEAVFEALRRADPDIPVLFISGHAKSDIATRRNGDGIAFLPKPFRSWEFLAAIMGFLLPTED